MNSFNEELSKEMTRDIESIMKEYRDPIEIERKKLYNKRKEILEDKNFGLNDKED